jgi:hypothetical protein
MMRAPIRPMKAHRYIARAESLVNSHMKVSKSNPRLVRETVRDFIISS